MRRIATVILVFLTLSCQREKPRRVARPDIGETKKILSDINRVLVEEDRKTIYDYIERNKLKGMVESRTGLFYLIYGKANGPLVKSGDIVRYAYKVSLLDGTVCYRSTPDSLSSFLVGKGGVPSGLEEGILYMRQGQKAKFIIPPHLAYGLLGDTRRIPARSIIIYDLELFEVHSKK